MSKFEISKIKTEAGKEIIFRPIISDDAEKLFFSKTNSFRDYKYHAIYRSRISAR